MIKLQRQYYIIVVVSQGSYLMTVLLGCPAGLKLVFDSDASKNATGKEHFCTPVDGVPCFYFYRGKLSVFEVPNWL